MSKSHFRSTLPSIDHPQCPKCTQTRMRLVRIERGPNGFEIRRFACAKCGHAMTVFVPAEIALSGRQNDLRPPK